jgi:hypothetical protein
MADLIELNLVVKDKGLKQSITTVSRLERELLRAVKAVDNQSMSQERLNKIMKSSANEYRSLGINAGLATIRVNRLVREQRASITASRAAKAAAEAMAEAFKEQERAAAEVARATQRLADRQRELRVRFQEGYAQFARQREAMRSLREAYRTGIITLQEYEAQLARIRTANQGNVRGTNNLGVAMQQTGYQVGDFMVQIQGGTNPMVAFGQQATQLVGVLYLMPPAMLAASRSIMGLSVSVGFLVMSLGIIIPIATAIGAYFMRMRDAAKEAEGGIDTLEEQMKSAKQATTSLSDEIERLNMGLKDTAEQAFARGVREAEAAILAVQRKLDDLGSDGPVRGQSNTARQYREDLAAANELLAARRIDLETYIKIRAELQRIKELEEKRLESVKLFFEYAQRDADLADEREAGVRQILDAVQTETQVLRDRAGLAAKELQYGADSAELRALQASIEERIYREQLKQNGILGNNQDEMVALRQSTLDVEAGLEDASISAERLANALQAANSFSSNLDASVVNLEARLAEASGQQGAVLANTIRQMEAEANLNAMRARAAGEDEIVVRNRLAIDQAQIDRYAEMSKALDDTRSSSRSAGRAATEAMSEAEKAAEALRKELESNVVSAISSVSSAFGDFISRGLTDFKGFVNQIIGSFQSMISNMIATAARNRIMISMGMGGSAAGTAASAGTGMIGNIGAGMTGVAGNIGSAATTALGMGGTFTGSFGAGMGATMTGGLAGGASAFGTGVGMIGTAGSTMSGLAMAAGAALPVLAAVAFAVALFRKNTKELDSGLNVTVKNMDALVTSFKTVETSRFFGLSKKTSTSTGGVSNEVSDPIVAAVTQIQQSVLDAAAAFGIGSDAFDNFSYGLKLSLKGLSEDQQMQKINEELAKMGDSFASLSGHFETMNELLEAANQRMQLQNRLDQLLGNNQAILTRQREAELAAMNKLNRPLAQAIYDLEDAQAAVVETQAAVANAFTALRASIDAEKDRIQNSFTGIIDGIKERLDVVNEALQQSRSIYDLLANALRSQQVSGDAAFAGRRSAAQSFLRGGDFRDEEQLREALSVVAEPSEGLFSSFVDYARDFGQTSFLIEEAKKIAEVQLTADEKQVLLLEEQIVSAEASRDAQLEALEQQYQIEVNQYNALLGIDASVKSVTEAIGTLRGAIAAMASAQKVQAAAVKDAAVASIVSPISGSIESKAKAEADLLAAQGVISSTSATESYTYKTDGFFGVGRKTKTGTRANPVYTQLQKDIEALSNTIAKEEQILAPAREQLESIGVVPTFAKGGMHTGGVRMVGESGPELEATGPSRIFSHNQTASMFKDPDLKDAVRSLKEEVAGLRSEQRQIQMDISKYTKRTYDIERKWDVEGLPATRT